MLGIGISLRIVGLRDMGFEKIFEVSTTGGLVAEGELKRNEGMSHGPNIFHFGTEISKNSNSRLCCIARSLRIVQPLEIRNTTPMSTEQ